MVVARGAAVVRGNHPCVADIEADHAWFAAAAAAVLA